MELRLIEGNPSKRPIPKVVKGRGARLLPPPDLGEEAQAVWREVVPELRRLGMLTRVDERAISDYCLCVVRLRAAEAEIDRLGMLVEGERGMVRNPALQTAREYRAAFVRWCAEFGFTPSARTRVAVPDQPEKSLEELLG